MARIKDIHEIYDLKLKQLHNKNEWENTLKHTSVFWKISFCEAMLLTAQNPQAQMCGTLTQWNKVGRYINRGERSIAVFKSRTDTQLTYLFDVKQTHGKAFNAKWKMSENIADGIVGKFNAENNENAVSLEDYLQKNLDRNIRTVYENSSDELKEACENDIGILRFIRASAECICMTRCGIEKSYDFAEVEKLVDVVSLIEIGNTATSLAQEVLINVDKIIRRKEYEIYRADVCGRPLRYPIRTGQGRTIQSEIYGLRSETNDTIGMQGGRSDERTRSDSARIGEYERAVPNDLERNWTESRKHTYADRNQSIEGNDSEQNLQRTSETTRRNSDSSERRNLGGNQDERELAIKGSSQAERSEFDKGNTAERRELTDNEDFTEYYGNNEVTEEIYDETVSENKDTVPYFSDKPVQLNSDTAFAQNLLDIEIIKGNGFENAKFRIEDFVKSEDPSNASLAKFLQQEYGIGGSSRNDPVLFSTYNEKGICLELKGKNGERQIINYSWSQVAKAVKKAIDENRYIIKEDKLEDDIQNNTKNEQISLLDAEYTNHSEKYAPDKPDLTQVAIESTDDFSDEIFHAELVHADVQNSDVSHGQIKDFYRIVTIGENGLLEPYDTKVFESRDKAQKAIEMNNGLTEISYDEIIHQAANNIGLSFNERSELAENHENKQTILTAYRVGDFYEFFGEDAKIVSEILSLSLTRRGETPMTGIPAHTYERYKQDLAIQGYFLADGDMRDINQVLSDYAQAEKHNSISELQPKQGEPLPQDKTKTEQTVQNENLPMVEVRHRVAPKLENYSFPDNFSYPNGEKARYNANVLAIKTLKKIEAERRNATPDEQDILAHYSGWGGTADAFDNTKENWSKEYAELKELLTEKEYIAARESTLTAFYTEPYIIKSIYKALENFGFTGGYILDPSVGTGNFLGNMPHEMAKNSKLFGVELDNLTARIARQLYPNAEIQNMGFERTKFKNNTFDVIVGNVPFGEFSLYDKEYEDHFIHDYFFLKSLDKLKAGGIMALITSSGTMDKEKSDVRKELYGKAHFVGGIRLPEDAFRSAGTKTVTDILFFKKLYIERNSEKYDINSDKNFIDFSYKNVNGNFFPVNKYFKQNPEMVLGNYEVVSGRYGKTPTVKSDGNTSERLDEAISKLGCRFEAEPTIEEFPEKEEYGDIPDDVQPYTYYVQDNKLFYAENRNAMIRESKDEPRIIGMCNILEHLNKLNEAQKRDCSDDELKELQNELNNAYDNFTKRYGFLNSRTNTSAFSDDVRSPRLMAIENVEEKPDGTITFAKADIFSHRTISNTHIPAHVDTPLEALHLSLNTRQQVDLEYISELCGKDKEEVISELGDRIYCNPAKNTGGKYTGWEIAEEYLSGNVRSKLALAQEVAKDNPEFERNVNALLDNQPPKIAITDIGFRLGTIYIPTEMVQDFIYETFETPNWQRENSYNISKSITVKYIDELNQWKITNCRSHNGVLVDETYGTKRLNAYELTELTLNQKRAVVNDYHENSNGKVEKKFNEKETILARECQDKIEQAFHDWIMADKSRVKTVENIFNERFNNIKSRTFNGDYISIPGMNPNLILRPHQKDVVARIAATGTCMMAHEVGAGKTAAMGAAGIYLKSIGACTKPLYVVPNAVVAQFAEELQRFFPEAKILAASSKDMEKNQRRRFLSKIAVGNYDAIIIPQSQFEKIPLSLERQEASYDAKISEITRAIQLAKADKGERFTVKALERQRKSLEKKIEKLRADFKKDDFITFEELGCDFLFVDEAHNYKNLAVFTKMNNVAGVNANANSQKAFDMEMKCRYLNEMHNGGGVVFATGTPISNSITELFVWQYLLQKQTLDDMQISYFDNWASVYGKISQSIEVKPSGDGFRMRTRFSNFVNLNELCSLFGEVFDIAKTEDMDLKLPHIKGGKPEMIICEKSPEQEEQTEIGIERARRIEDKLVKPDEDNMLAVCTYMTKVALDARIIDENAKEYEGGKVALCADKIIEIYRENPNMAQAVFCDTNTPKNNSFSVYQALKDRLIKSRVFSEKEIAFVHDAANDKQRLDLFEKVNRGEIKVIIGSTGKLGTGVNIQQRLCALHHLDAPYRPSDVEQRNGRGIRQGNLNKEVFVGYYSTKGTFDNYRWQILEKKQQIISQIMSGKPAARTCEDIDDVALTFSEMKAATTGNPLIAEKMTVDNEVNRLKLLQSNYYQQQCNFEYDINTRYPGLIARKENLLTLLKQDIETIESNSKVLGDDFKITLDGKIYSERKEAGKRLGEMITKYQVSNEYKELKEKELGNYNGFKLFAVRNGYETQLQLVKSGKYTCDYSTDGYGGIIRISNLYDRIPKYLNELQNEIEQIKKQLENAKNQFGIPFPHEQDLKDLIARQSQINIELEFGKSEEVVLGDEIDENEEMEM